MVTASRALAMPRAEFAKDTLGSVHDDGSLEKQIKEREGQLYAIIF